MAITAMLVAGVAGTWLGWRLRQGPLAVPILDPYVEQAFVGRDPDLDVAFSGTVLVWPPESRVPEMRVLGLRLTRKDGRAVAEFPELSFRPSVRAFLRGRLAVGAVGLTGVRLALTRDAQGRLSLAGLKPAEADRATPSPFAWLVETSDPDSANAYLRRISIRGAEIALDDRLSTSKWRVTGANLDLRRREDRIEADLRAELVVHLETAVVRLPLEADVTASFGEAATLGTVEFEAAGTRGYFDRGIEGRPPLVIRSLRVTGRFAAEGERFELAKLELRTGDSKLLASGTYAGATREARFRGSVAELPAQDLDLAWPFGVAPAARTWCLGNLRDGKVAKAEFSLHHPGGERGKTTFRFEAAVAGMTVDYLAPLEPLRAVDGAVRLDEKKLTADVSTGTAGALRLTRGAMTIDFVDAAVPANVDAEIEGPTDDLLAFLDSPPLGYPSRFGLPTKGVGGRTAGHVELRFPLAGEARASALTVDARASLRGEDAEGTIALAVASGEIQKLEVDRFRSAKNELTASVARKEDGSYEAALTGARLDLQPLIDRVRSAERAAPAVGRPYALRFDLARVAAPGGIEWTDVRGNMTGDGERVRRFDGSGALVGGGATKLSVEPIAEGRRRFRASSDDAGRVLQAFGIIESARGGRLDLHAVTDDRTAETNASGRLEVSEVRIEKAPILARILSVGSFDGIADVFRNEGLLFRRARVPFTWSKGKIEVEDARAIGGIGLTADGSIDVRSGTLDIRGELIPAYTLNTALGKVPWIGEYLTGKGGGVFGISYRVKGTRAAPDVAVNPLTALAPGKLREMFLTPFGL